MRQPVQFLLHEDEVGYPAQEVLRQATIRYLREMPIDHREELVAMAEYLEVQGYQVIAAALADAIHKWHRQRLFREASAILLHAGSTYP